MKTFFAALIALAVGFGAAFAIVSAQKEKALNEQQAKLEAKWQAEKEELEAELHGKRIPGRSRTIEKKVNILNHRSAEEILQNLLTLKPVGATRIAIIHKIVHELEDLAELQDDAVPAVRSFLARNEDIDYSEKTSDEGDVRDRGGDRRSRSWSRSSPSTEFTLPPSLRIGLLDVLGEIGTQTAQEGLADILGTSGRAVEVACAVRMLEALSPGTYRDAAINAAKELLRNPPSIANPNRLDEQAENYLYAILEMYKDNSFITDAGKQLISSDGKLDRNARDYLTRTQGEQAIPALIDAFKSKSLTNEWDKASVAGRVLDYVGKNDQANNLLNDIVTNPELDPRMRAYALMELAGGRRGDVPTDPDLIKARLQVIEAMKPGITDQSVFRAAESTEKKLVNSLEGKSTDNSYGGHHGGGGGPTGPQASGHQ